MNIVYKLSRAFNTLFMEPKKCLLCDIRIYDDNIYCQAHKCSLCIEKKMINKDFCINHSCNKDNCNNCRFPLEIFCNEHLSGKCILVDCSHSKIRKNNTLQDYCAMHICMHSNCNKYADKNNNLCVIHKCNNIFCNGEKTSDSYCDKHSSDFSD